MIELSKREIEVIEMQLSGKISILTTDEEVQQTLLAVIDKALKLQEETDEDDDGDLIDWYYKKYKSQQQ